MWTLDEAHEVPMWRAAGLGGVTAAFTTRLGGVSAPPFDTLNLGRSTLDRPEAVAENRARVLAALALDARRLVTAGQVHGAGIVTVERPGHVPECDALLTRVPGLAIAVTTADCMPIVLTASGLVCVVHSGWRGAALGLPGAALRAMTAAGAPAGEIAVHFGPCIRRCCYPVGPEVARQFPAACLEPDGDRWRLDLPRAARLQLEEQGLDPARIHDTGACTACDARRYFSHRRDGAPSGRHWAVAAVTG